MPRRAMASDTGFEMDQDLAKRLLVEGGTLVLLDVPRGTDFGIDLKSWNTGEDFKGVKMIPPGFHYVHYSAANEFGELAPRVGFIHNFKKSEFVVKRWDSQKEDISSEVSEEVIERLKDNIKNLDRYLGPYPYDIWKQWKELINHIDDSVVQRCAPLCGFVRSALELENCDDASRPRGGESSQKRQRRSGLSIEEKEELLLPHLKPVPGTELRLTKLPEKHYPDGASPTEITQHSLDTSYTLETLLTQLKQPMELIAEMQLAFVCFLAGQSLDAFEHWKRLVSLICGADAAIPNRRSIYVEFLSTLEVQLRHVPEDVLCDIVASNNFVYHNLRKLFATIEMSSEVDGRLKSQAVRMRERLTSKFQWDFSDMQDEDDEDAPVVVTFE
ncbi:protein AAR2 homolog isoform X2 [Cephus cinctus]|uniref:Protein AAR2 homolog n=1 Tax=Cephus cinctus TaxID=211228 RepID=A0AAJ7BQ25_CEPCN|nr:protein AAR2 homolog isoform X2 [Cephus cinctus]